MVIILYGRKAISITTGFIFDEKGSLSGKIILVLCARFNEGIIMTC